MDKVKHAKVWHYENEVSSYQGPPDDPWYYPGFRPKSSYLLGTSEDGKTAKVHGIELEGSGLSDIFNAKVYYNQEEIL